MAVTAMPRARFSEAEWRTRVDLAACYRLIDLFGWSDLINTRTTARIPGPAEHFLINRFGMLYDEVTASSLIKIDSEGNNVEPSDEPVNRGGFALPSVVHRARPDIACCINRQGPPTVPCRAVLAVRTSGQDDRVAPGLRRRISGVAVPSAIPQYNPAPAHSLIRKNLPDYLIEFIGHLQDKRPFQFLDLVRPAEHNNFVPAGADFNRDVRCAPGIELSTKTCTMLSDQKLAGEASITGDVQPEIPGLPWYCSLLAIN